ncbi:hypothetical protein [Calidifontibacter indicus]|uniref:hypothetical protein n=1 Tax=Calidifontibacter indicus TaxID=419650 RepID=UPI003D7098F7
MTLAGYPQTESYFKQNLLWSDKPWTPYIDTYLHQGLAAQILTRGPVSWPTVAGEDLGYQWFAHAWMAHVTETSGVPLDHVLMRFLPTIMPIVAVAKHRRPGPAPQRKPGRRRAVGRVLDAGRQRSTVGPARPATADHPFLCFGP